MALNQGPQPYFSSPFYEANFKVKAEKRARRGRGRDVTVVAVGRTLAAVVIPGLISQAHGTLTAAAAGGLRRRSLRSFSLSFI